MKCKTYLVSTGVDISCMKMKPFHNIIKNEWSVAFQAAHNERAVINSPISTYMSIPLLQVPQLPLEKQRSNGYRPGPLTKCLRNESQ